MPGAIAHLSVDTRSPTPVYVQIVDQVRDRVRSGGLPAGSPLPAVRQLASDLGVNPNTVAKAYSLLEREGVLQTVSRRGTFVAEAAPQRAALALDRRVEDAVHRVLAEAAAAGIERQELLAALRRELEEGGPPRRRDLGR